MFQCLEEHSKVIVCGVQGSCDGLALAMLALCDVVVATDTTVFSWPSKPLLPGLSILSSSIHSIPKSVVSAVLISIVL